MGKIKQIMKPIGASLVGTGLVFSLTCSPLEDKLNAELPKEPSVGIENLSKEELKRYNRMIELVNEISNLKGPYCFKYNRLMVEFLFENLSYKKTPYAWNSYKTNKVVKWLKGSFKDCSDYLKPLQTIVLFKNLKSERNKSGRIGTHTGLLWEYDEKGIPVFDHMEDGHKKRESYSEMWKRGFRARVILAPRYRRKK